MANKSLETRIIFSGVDNVSRVLSGIQGAVAGASAKLNAAGNAMRATGSMMGAAISFPVVAGMKSVSDSFAAFENSMIRVDAITGATDEQMQALSKTAKSLAEVTPFSPSQLAEGMEQLALMGFEMETIMGLMPGIADTATITGLTIEHAADKMTNSIQALYGSLDGEELARQAAIFNDQMAYVYTNTNLTADQLINSVQRFSPVARTMGLELADMNAMFGGLALGGIKGERAARGLRTILIRLSAPTKAARQALADLNIDLGRFRTEAEKPIDVGNITNALEAAGQSNATSMAGQLLDVAKMEGDVEDKITQMIGLVESSVGDIDALGEQAMRDAFTNMFVTAAGSLDMVAVMEALTRATGGDMDASLGDKIFGKHQFEVGNTLLQQWTEIHRLMQDIRSEAEGSTEQLAGDFARSYSRTLEQLASRFENFQIALMEPNAEAVKGFVNSVGEQLNRLSNMLNNNPAIARMALYGALIAGAMGPALIYLGLAANGLAAIGRMAAFALTPLTLIGRAGSLVAASFGGATKAARGLAIGGLKRLGILGVAAAGAFAVIQRSWDSLTTAWDNGKYRIKTSLHDLAGAFEDALAGDMAGAVEHLNNVISVLKPVADEMFAALGEGVSQLRADMPALDAFIKVFEDGQLAQSFERVKYAVKPAVQAFQNLGAAFNEILSQEMGDGSTLGETLARLTAQLVEFAAITGLEVIAAALKLLAQALNGLADGLRYLKDTGWFTQESITMLGLFAGAIGALAAISFPMAALAWLGKFASILMRLSGLGMVTGILKGLAKGLSSIVAKLGGAAFAAAATTAGATLGGAWVAGFVRAITAGLGPLGAWLGMTQELNAENDKIVKELGLDTTQPFDFAADRALAIQNGAPAEWFNAPAMDYDLGRMPAQSEMGQFMFGPQLGAAPWVDELGEAIAAPFKQAWQETTAINWGDTIARGILSDRGEETLGLNGPAVPGTNNGGMVERIGEIRAQTQAQEQARAAIEAQNQMVAEQNTLIGSSNGYLAMIASSIGNIPAAIRSAGNTARPGQQVDRPSLTSRGGPGSALA